MIAFNNNIGGQGDDEDRHHIREDMKMIASAIKKGWNIPKNVYDDWPRKAIEIVDNDKNNLRERVRAMELMVKMHGQNQNDDPATQKVEHTGTIEVSALRTELMNDKNYLEYQRKSIGHIESGLVCTPCEQGEVEVPKASNGTRPGSNGSGNGNGKAAYGGDAS